MTNDTIHYKEAEDSSLLPNIEYESSHSLKTVLYNIGIEMDELIEDEKNLTRAIHEKIEAGYLIIVWVDCYYLSIRADTYHKFHNPHTILIYGIDTEKQLYYAIEHREIESLKYERKLIPFSDIIDGYKSFNETYKTEFFNVKPFHFYKLNEESSYHQNINEIALDYHNKLLKNIQTSENKAAIIQSHLGTINTYLKNQRVLDEKLDDIFTSMNDIINAKKAELYKSEYLFPNEMSTALNDIIKLWVDLRIPFARYKYSLQYKSDDFLILSEIYKSIIDVEIAWSYAIKNLDLISTKI